MDSKNFNFSSLIELVRGNIKIFILVGVIAIVLGTVFSGKAFITPLFKSTAIVYPANIESYSDENETEQLMQIFAATDVRNFLIDKYNLWDRFNIDKDSKGAYTNLFNEYNDRIVVSKTTFESVKLEVWDEDPAIAQKMAKDVLDQVNVKIGNLINSSARGRMESYKQQMDYQVQLMDSLADVMQTLSNEKGVLEYANQSREVTRGYIEVVARGGSEQATEKIKEIMSDLQDAGGLYYILLSMSEQATMEYSVVARKYFEERAEAYQQLNYTDVILSPEQPDKKSYPVRWLIVFLVLVSSLILTVIILAVFARK